MDNIHTGNHTNMDSHMNMDSHNHMGAASTDNMEEGIFLGTDMGNILAW
jgi:hypothetical protein